MEEVADMLSEGGQLPFYPIKMLPMFQSGFLSKRIQAPAAGPQLSPNETVVRTAVISESTREVELLAYLESNSQPRNSKLPKVF